MSTGRAIIGVIALYALLLQGFLGALVTSGPAVAGIGILCGADRSDTPDAPSCPHHACCTSVQAAGLVAPPAPPFTTVRPAERGVAPAIWRDAIVHGARAPPERPVPPRGPPAA